MSAIPADFTQADFTIVQNRTAQRLVNSKGLSQTRIHFNLMGNQQSICDLAITQLENGGRDTGVDSLNCFTNKWWSVMDLGNGERVLLNRNSAIKRLGALGILSDVVTAALNSHRMDRIHQLIVQRHNNCRQRIHDDLRLLADQWIPQLFDEREYTFPEGIRARLITYMHNHIPPQLTQVIVERYLHCYLLRGSFEVWNDYEALKLNLLRDRLRTLLIPYAETYGIYAKLEARVSQYLAQTRPGLTDRFRFNLTAFICADCLVAPNNRETIIQYIRLDLPSNLSPATLEQNKNALIQQLYDTLNEEIVQSAEQHLKDSSDLPEVHTGSPEDTAWMTALMESLRTRVAPAYFAKFAHFFPALADNSSPDLITNFCNTILQAFAEEIKIAKNEASQEALDDLISQIANSIIHIRNFETSFFSLPSEDTA